MTMTAQQNKKRITKKRRAKAGKVIADTFLRIAPARVKTQLDTEGINVNITRAVEELKNAEEHKTYDEKKVETLHPLKTIAQLSEATRTLLGQANLDANERAKVRAKKESGEVDMVKKAARDAMKAKVDRNRAEALEERKKKGLPIPVYAAELAMLSHTRIRFGKHVSALCAVFASTIVEELVANTLDIVVADGKSKIMPSHLIEAIQTKPLKFAYLYKDTKFLRDAIKADKTMRDAKEAKAAMPKETADAFATLMNTAPATPAAVPATADSKEAAVKRPVKKIVMTDDEREYLTYMTKIFAYVINFKAQTDKKAYANLITSQPARAFGSKLVVAIINTLMRQIKTAIKRDVVRTVSHGMVKNIIETILAINDEIDVVKTIELLNERITKYYELAKATALAKKTAAAAATATTAATVATATIAAAAASASTSSASSSSAPATATTPAATVAVPTHVIAATSTPTPAPIVAVSPVSALEDINNTSPERRRRA